MTKSSKSGKAAKKRTPAKNPRTDNMSAAAQVIELFLCTEPLEPTAELGAQADSVNPPAAQTVTASTRGNKIIVQDNIKSALLALPAEIKRKIWILAITVDEPLEPKQIRDRSNKFLWSKAQIDENGKKVVKNAAQLTVVALSKVCRTLYEEVSLTHLFYEFNHFRFETKTGYRVNRAIGPINYLVALTSPRMEAIQSIACDWPGQAKDASKLFTSLAACDGLQVLELTLYVDVLSFLNPSSNVFKVPGFKDALIAVEGLQTLNMRVCDGMMGGMRTEGQAAIDRLELPMKERMKQPRGTTKYNLETFRVAQRDAHLDIHGDGRLGEDKKPGLIASRTRNQLRKLETIKDDGTLPERVLPKYDSDGDLAWHAELILDSRPSEPDGFPPSVEFKLKCHSLTGIHSWQRSELPAETSWEDVAVLNNFRHLIAFFYQSNPSAYGKEAVIEAWNLRDQDVRAGNELSRHHHSWTCQIIKIAEREEVLERLRVEAAVKEAFKVAQEAKKTKKIKVTKVTRIKKSKTYDH